ENGLPLSVAIMVAAQTGVVDTIADAIAAPAKRVFILDAILLLLLNFTVELTQRRHMRPHPAEREICLQCGEQTSFPGVRFQIPPLSSHRYDFGRTRRPPPKGKPTPPGRGRQRSGPVQRARAISV